MTQMETEFDVEATPAVLKGKTLSKVVRHQFNLTRGWFESDKHLRNRVFWVAYGGSRNHEKALTPIQRILRRILGKGTK